MDPGSRLVARLPAAGQSGRAVAAPPANCAARLGIPLEAVPGAKVLGYPVLRHRGFVRGSDSPAEVWVAPQLDCLVMRRETMADGYRNVVYAISVKEGEPDPALFAVPEDYEDGLRARKN